MNMTVFITSTVCNVLWQEVKMLVASIFFFRDLNNRLGLRVKRVSDSFVGSLDPTDSAGIAVSCKEVRNGGSRLEPSSRS